jgi:hypothetical protein
VFVVWNLFGLFTEMSVGTIAVGNSHELHMALIMKILKSNKIFTMFM